jgi:hypothetical protein
MGVAGEERLGGRNHFHRQPGLPDCGRHVSGDRARRVGARVLLERVRTLIDNGIGMRFARRLPMSCNKIVEEPVFLLPQVATLRQSGARSVRRVSIIPEDVQALDSLSTRLVIYAPAAVQLQLPAQQREQPVCPQFTRLVRDA